MNINAIITEELQVKSHQVDAAVKLIDEGLKMDAPFLLFRVTVRKLPEH